MATRSLTQWTEITGLDFTFYGDRFTETAVGLVAALRFEGIPDQSILEFVERGRPLSLLLREGAGRTDVDLTEDQSGRSRALMVAVAKLPAAEELAIYRSVEKMIHSKLCRQAGLEE